MNPIQKQPTCSICLDELLPPLQQEETICGHIFHKVCLDKWKGYRKHSCPDCRSDLKGRNIIKIEFDPNSLDSLLSAREEVLKYQRTCQSQTTPEHVAKALVNVLKYFNTRIDAIEAKKRKEDLICFVAYSVIIPLFLSAMYYRIKEINEIRQTNNLIFDKLEKAPLFRVLHEKRRTSNWPFSWEKHCYLQRLDDIITKRPLSEVLSLKEEISKFKLDATLHFFLKELDKTIKTKLVNTKTKLVNFDDYIP